MTAPNGNGYCKAHSGIEHRLDRTEKDIQILFTETEKIDTALHKQVNQIKSWIIAIMGALIMNGGIMIARIFLNEIFAGD
jgi:hypothetical protein